MTRIKEDERQRFIPVIHSIPAIRSLDGLQYGYAPQGDPAGRLYGFPHFFFFPFASFSSFAVFARDIFCTKCHLP